MVNRLRTEGGTSLLEVMVASAVMAAVLAIVTSFLVSAQTAVVRQENRSVSNDQARAAMEQLDREVRSSGFILTLDEHTLVVHTQSNAPTAGERCVQWVVQDTELRRRQWPVGDPAGLSGWRTIASGIINEDLGQATFVLPDLASNRVTTGGRAVEVTFLVNSDFADEPGGTVSIQQSLSGRNVAAGPVAAGAPWPPTTPPPPCEVIP